MSHGGREGTPEIGEVGRDDSADEARGDDGGWGVDGAVGWAEDGAVEVDEAEVRGICATIKYEIKIRNKEVCN